MRAASKPRDTTPPLPLAGEGRGEGGAFSKPTRSACLPTLTLPSPASGRGFSTASSEFDELLADARACTFCSLPAGPRPILQASATSRLVIASQAPGSIAHGSGIPFQDPSGYRLRDWLGLDEPTFYDRAQVAILPMGFCYPGRLAGGGDMPPAPPCAPRWRPRFLARMPAIRLILLVGGYSQADALGPGRMTDRVRQFQQYLPRYFPLPHPSWRTGVWERRNPWFTADVLPALKREVRRALGA